MKRIFGGGGADGPAAHDSELARRRGEAQAVRVAGAEHLEGPRVRRLQPVGGRDEASVDATDPIAQRDRKARKGGGPPRRVGGGVEVVGVFVFSVLRLRIRLVNRRTRR